MNFHPIIEFLKTPTIHTWTLRYLKNSRKFKLQKKIHHKTEKNITSKISERFVKFDKKVEKKIFV